MNNKTKVNSFALSFTPDGLLLPKLKDLYRHYIDDVDPETRIQITAAYDRLGGTREDHIQFYREAGLPIWLQFLQDLASNKGVNYDFEPFDDEIKTRIEDAFKTANGTNKSEPGLFASVRLVFGVVCLLFGFLIPLAILFGASSLADQATRDVSATVAANLASTLEDLELPELIAGCEDVVEEIRRGDRDFSDYDTTLAALQNSSDETTRVLDEFNLLTKQINTYENELKSVAPKGLVLLEALKECTLELGTKKEGDKEIPDTMKAAEFLVQLKKGFEGRQLNDQIEAHVSECNDFLALFRTCKDFSDNIALPRPLPPVIALTDIPVEKLTEIRALYAKLEGSRFGEDDLNLGRIKEHARELSANVDIAKKELEIDFALEGLVRYLKTASLAEFEANLGRAFLRKVESLAADPNLLAIRQTQCDDISDFVTTLDDAIEALASQEKSLNEVAPAAKLIEQLNQLASQAFKEQMPGTSRRKESIERLFRGTVAKLDGLIASFEEAANATQGLSSISDTVRDLTFRAVSPVMILLVLVSGLFITIGVTSVATYVKSREYRTNLSSWRTNARLYAEIAAAFGAEGYDAAGILRLMQDEAPRMEKAGTNLATPVTQILSEGRRIVREFKKL